MLLRGAYSSMHRTFEAHFSELNATADQFVLLNVLAEESGLIQQELVQRVYSDPNTITAMLNRMEARGLIERRTHDEDGRARCVHLTVKGRRLQRRLHESAKVLHQRLAAIATPQEFKITLQVLERIAAAMAPVENRKRKSTAAVCIGDDQ